VISDVNGREHADELQRTLIGRWRTTLDTIPQMVWSVGSDGSDEFYNRRWLEFTGVELGARSGRSRLELVHPDDRGRAAAIWERSLTTGEPYEAQYRLQHVSGTYRWVLSRAQAERDINNNVIRWYGTCTDVHEGVAAQEEVLANQQFVQRLIAASPDSLLLLDGAGSILFANQIAAGSLGIDDPGELIGKSWSALVPASVQRAAKRAFALARRTGAAAQFAANLGAEDVAWWDVIVTPVSDEKTETRLLVTSRDITHQKEAEEQARWAADHDPLTQLASRAVLHRRLLAAIENAKSSGGQFALLLLDVDEFKRTNDALGHDAGDALLCTFADRLRKAVRADDLVARLGGDEFAILLKGVSSEAELTSFADKLFDLLAQPCDHAGNLIACKASIGASIFPAHGDACADLLKASDLALYAAKTSGRGVLRMFEPKLRATAQLRNSMLMLAKEALVDDLVAPHYQPKVDLRSGEVTGYEALLRWNHPRQGLQGPGSIKAAFEDLALAAEISERMIDCVIADMRRWLNEGTDFHHIAINVGAAEMRHGEFADRLLERLRKAAIPSRCIQVEITESVFLGRGAEAVEQALRTLSRNGVSIALDDFGTGFASLSHLKQFPVDVIKIDQSFIRDIKAGSEDTAIVNAVLGLGRSLHIDVVAEGIETIFQHRTLADLGCRHGQGFLYGRPARELRASPIKTMEPRRSTAG
jgi:diguanylate cyclase (GGDEF)-like protein/PAS domain S-box-containing protein